MTDLAELLAPGRLLDLTQPLGPATVLWPGSRPFAAEVEATHDADGVYFRHLSLPEHAGTHFDAPAHFDPTGATAEHIPPGLLVRPAALLDVRELAADDPRYALDAATIERLEDREGRLEPGSVALVCTGWDRHRGSAERYVGAGATPALPGIAADAALLLVERGLVGVGIDTLSIDPGHAVTAPAHRITMPAGLWHLEGLVGLERLPARGAWLIAAPLLLVEGSGTPARVFAILPS